MGVDRNEDRNANVVAAAEAAASWARARRATWTRAPVAVATSAREPLPPIEFESTPAPAPAPSAGPVRIAPVASARPPEPAAPPIAPAPSQTTAATPGIATPIFVAPRPPSVAEPPPFVATAREEVDDGAAPTSFSLKWIATAAGAAALVGVAVLGWPYLSRSRSTPPDRSAQDDPAFVGPRMEAAKTAGALRVTSTPAGAQVLVDGKAQGVTPLTVNQLSPGKHEVVLKSDAGMVRRSITIAGGQTETIDEQIFSGWVTVYSPFEVAMAEGQRMLRPDERNQVMLAPGIHELRLMNKALAYEAVLQVDVKPGEGTNVRLTPPPSSLTVTARETAEVLVDGVRAGETPLNNFSVPLGTHEIVVRRANGTEKRYTVTIGVKPYSLNAES